MHLRLPGEHAHVLLERAVHHPLAQPSRDLLPGRVEGDSPARLAPVDRQDVEAEAGLDEPRVDPGVGSVEERLLEFG